MPRFALLILTAGLAAGPALASPAPATSAAANSFAQTNLIASSASSGAKLVDKNLTNAWGLAAGPNDPLWVSDNNSGDATVYSGVLEPQTAVPPLGKQSILGIYIGGTVTPAQPSATDTVSFFH